MLRLELTPIMPKFLVSSVLYIKHVAGTTCVLMLYLYFDVQVYIKFISFVHVFKLSIYFCHVLPLSINVHFNS